MNHMPNQNVDNIVLKKIIQYSYAVFREAKRKNWTKSVIVSEISKMIEREVRNSVNQVNKVD